MPFVRVSRDKRGYEHTYLIQPPKVLYWFRTPPGIRVGRTPFDRDTQRAIEAQNPGISFDWPRLVATSAPPPLSKDVEHWRERRRAEKAARRARAAEAAEAAGPLAATAPPDEPDIQESGELGSEPEPDEGQTPISIEGQTPISAGPANPPAAGKRRRRRRGGRRRQKGSEPVHGQTPYNDLDQVKPPEDSSKNSGNGD